MSEYSFETLNGCGSDVLGHVIDGLVVQGIGEKVIRLPEVKTNPHMPDCYHEVASPSLVRKIPEIAEYADNFVEPDPNAKTLMIIGRSCGEAMSSTCYGNKAPWVYRTPLGWCLVGEMCTTKNTAKRRASGTANKTCEGCKRHINVKSTFPTKEQEIIIRKDIFATFNDDEQPGSSAEDKRFMEIMNECVTITAEGSLQAPIPFKSTSLPDNRAAVQQRMKSTLKKMMRSEPEIFVKCKEIIHKYLEKGYIELVPDAETKSTGITNYIPWFVVKHPFKDSIRIVFDAKATYKGSSLNDHILPGPDLTNELRGVIFRFREGVVAVVADIEGMYHAFKVAPQHRDALRFFWVDESDTENLKIYRATSHPFGCRSSGAIASYCLRKIGHDATDLSEGGQDFVQKSFYVDDGLPSYDDSKAAIETLKEVRGLLASRNVRLHKILSNDKEVVEAFPESERADSYFAVEDPMCQRTLGVFWNAKQDYFSIRITLVLRPFTKRGILAVINGQYDPIGLFTPVILGGKVFQRQVLPPKEKMTSEIEACGWDDPLPLEYKPKWDTWTSSLKDLEDIKIPRCFVPHTSDWTQTLHVYCDASIEAIGWVIYMRSTNPAGEVHVALVTSSAKVAPQAAATVPRLELNSAVGSAECAAKVVTELKKKPHAVYFYSDSKITLGYIKNKSKRFVKYVERRVSIITSLSDPKQWSYVDTAHNPADLASRPQTPKELVKSKWFSGPDNLWQTNLSIDDIDVTREELPEEVKEKKVMKATEATELVKSLCSRRSSFLKVVRVIKILLGLRNLADRARQRLAGEKAIQLAPRNPEVTLREAEVVTLKLAQHESFEDEMRLLSTKKGLNADHPLMSLSPFIEEQTGLMRVGGRLRLSPMSDDVKHPILVPRSHPITPLLVRQVHAKVRHQGRHITLGAVRQEGYHIQSGSSMIKNEISKCVYCRKLRGQLCSQKMADLPFDRLEEVVPFTNCGVDLFGPFTIHDGVSTRRSTSTKKEYVVIFVCMTSRAIHLEPCPFLDTSSFWNALRRFFAIRGTCKRLRSDNGSNLRCTSKQMDKLNLEKVRQGLANEKIEWDFNPPGASHFGGHYERKIGAVRRILEATCVHAGKNQLSRDEFHTLLQESASVVNNTPLWEVSSSPDDPAPLTPASLLTLRDKASPDSDVFTERDLLAYGKERWKRVQFLANEFWRKWRLHYLHELQARNKWRRVKPNIRVGDIVLIRDKNLNRNYWPMGLVEEVKTSSDGLVRSAYVKIGKKKCYRTVADLVVIVHANEG